MTHVTEYLHVCLNRFQLLPLSGQGGGVEKNVATATRVVNRDNLFALDSQKVLFPVS